MTGGRSQAAWGEYAPRGGIRYALRFCAALPAGHRLFYSVTKAVRKLVRRGPVRYYDVEAHGLRLRLVSRGNYSDTRLLFSPQFFDAEELDWLCGELAAGGTFLDIGGNIGGYSLIVARRLGSRVAVHTVEPDAELCERMLFNARSSGVDITVHRTALSDYEGEGAVLRSEKQSGENTFVAEAGTGGASISVPVTTLLTLCRAAGIRAITALKIDIEGHEEPVLSRFFADAERALWPKAIVIERVGDRPAMVGKLVGQLGYRVVGLTKRNALLKL